MAKARRLFVIGVVALALAACGLDVVGVASDVPSDAGADRVAPSLPDTSAPDAPIIDAGCVYTGGFCNPLIRRSCSASSSAKTAASSMSPATTAPSR